MASIRAFDRYIIAEPIASFRSPSSAGHGDVPYQLIDDSLAPMWKFTDCECSAHASQNGSHSGCHSSGAPRSCGSLQMLTPRSPIGRGAVHLVGRRLRRPTTA